MHPRNRHRDGYPFAELIRRSPELAHHVRANPYGAPSIDFSDPEAVLALNRALLRHYYGIPEWEIPAGYLCPPVPGRADYVHHLADLLGSGNDAAIPRGESVVVLDIGVGANCIYPIIGQHEYGWRFVGADIDRVALKSAEKLIARNPSLAGKVELRLQSSRASIFRGIIQPGEVFAATICNPPFHGSALEATAATRRKLRNLANGKTVATIVQNFGGQSNELWYRGGESAFVRRMIAESGQFRDASRWFTTLLSKSETLPIIHRALESAKVSDVRTIEMAQGQKKSRIVAWRFGAHRNPAI